MKSSFTTLAIGALVAAAGIAAPAEAATFAIDFSLNDRSRANAIFSYDDEATGVIGFEGLTAFRLTTVGGPIVMGDGTTMTFPSFTYSLDDVLALSNRFFAFDTDTKMISAQGFEGFAFPLVFAAYNDAGSTGFLIDLFNNASGGTITDYQAGYQEGYNRVSLSSVVPEPASWALMLAGFAMVAGATRYRRRTTRVAFA